MTLLYVCMSLERPWGAFEQGKGKFHGCKTRDGRRLAVTAGSTIFLGDDDGQLSPAPLSPCFGDGLVIALMTTSPWQQSFDYE